ncbi:MAG: Bax inhibitor-1/YccA family protein [Nocardioidaceae bacterium]|nr:Bax inhibitor-1/YccA family protein [Nocardioidaceae bacterium]
MQSNNPVFARAEGFNGQAAQSYGNQGYPAGGQGYQGYAQGYGQTPYPQTTDPSSWQQSTGPVVEERMTIDSVVNRTAIMLLIVVASAAATWIAMPDEYLGPAWMIGAFGGLGLSFAIAFMRKVSPVLVIAYSVLEGMFLGAVSETFEAMFDGVVPGAVMGTTAAFVATLAAYKFFNIQVNDKFRKYVTIAMFGFFGVVMLDFLMGMFGNAMGFNGFGTLGLITSFVGLAIGIAMLMLDFDMVERGVAAGLPEQESWRAAFGLVVTLIWIYIQMLRILAIMQSDN